MKRIAAFSFVIGLGLLLLAGCQTATSTAKALNDTTAQLYSQTGVNMTQGISGAMGAWAEGGSITGVTGTAVKGASVRALAITAEAGGWYHLTESSTTIYEIGRASCRERV